MTAAADDAEESDWVELPVLRSNESHETYRPLALGYDDSDRCKDSRSPCLPFLLCLRSTVVGSSDVMSVLGCMMELVPACCATCNWPSLKLGVSVYGQHSS